jgi:hypothetical protein
MRTVAPVHLPSSRAGLPVVALVGTSEAAVVGPALLFEVRPAELTAPGDALSNADGVSLGVVAAGPLDAVGFWSEPPNTRNSTTTSTSSRSSAIARRTQYTLAGRCPTGWSRLLMPAR